MISLFSLATQAVACLFPACLFCFLASGPSQPGWRALAALNSSSGNCVLYAVSDGPAQLKEGLDYSTAAGAGKLLAIFATQDSSRARSGGSNEVSGSDRQGSGLLMLIILAAIVLMIFGRQAKAAAGALKAALEGVSRAGEAFFKAGLVGIVTWLKGDSPPEGEEKSRQVIRPYPSLKGILCICIGASAAIADYGVLAKSISLIWPWAGSASTLALIVILLTALVGFSIHSLKGTLVRFILVTIALSLILIQGYLSYLRTIEIERIREIEQGHRAMIAPEVGAAGIRKLRTGERLVARADQQPQSPSPRPDGKDLSGSAYGKAMLAALLALLLASGELIGFYTGFYLAGGAVVWIISSPVLLAFALPYSAFHIIIASRIVEALNVLLQASLDAFIEAGRLAKELGKRLRPPVLLERFYAWREQAHRHRSHLMSERASLAAEREFESLRKAKERSQYETEFDHMARLNEACRNAVEGWLSTILDDLTKAYAALSRDYSENILESSKEEIRESLKSAAAPLASSSASLSVRLSKALQDADAYPRIRQH